MKHFTQVKTADIASVGYRITQYSHESGATLVHIYADTPERAFCAAFQTVPKDSTGVFHILEHSCLSGSENYPIRSPILYMMKHSMQTYLNAITFQGKTMYPCASCHPGDFENLMRVYLDAVFHPRLTKETFLREGWHLEGEDNIRGVVYNEMQGALSSLDARMYHAMKGDLYPDTYQRHNSGGNPTQIPDLSYEAFLEAHHQHYSPSNCVLFLRGDFAPEEYEQLLHETLLALPTGGKALPYDVQTAASGVSRHAYPISEGESTENRTGLVFSYNVGNYEQGERLFALSLLAQYLMENQNSRLLKALLDTGLTKDARYMLSQERQAAFGLVIYNTEEACREQLAQVIRKTIENVIETGVDKAALRASLAAMTFRTKENALAVRGRALEDFAAISNNLFFGLSVEHGMDPDAILNFLEQALDTDYYENLLREVFLENPITACSVLVPQPQAADAAHKATVQRLLSRLSEGEKDAVSGSDAPPQPDSEADLAKMPCLTRQDLAVEPRMRPFAADGRVLYTCAETAGIVYLRYYFSMDGLSEAECLAARLLSVALTQLSTERSSVAVLSNRIKSTVGQMNFYPTVISRSCDDTDPYFMVTVSCLRKHLRQTMDLVSEILAGTLYEAKEAAYVIASEYNGMLRSFAQNGMSIAQNRAGAGIFLGARYMDLFGGHEYLQYLKECNADPGLFCDAAEALAKKLFVDANLKYIGVTCSEMPDPLLPQLPAGNAMQKRTIALCQGQTAYAVASGVNYNAAVIRYDDLLPFSGKHLVAAKLLSLGYLWNKIREDGGAYGAFLSINRNGRLLAGSYRDPHVGGTLQVFRSIADYLQSHDWTERELLGGMIGVTAELINPQTPAFEGTDNEISYLTGYTVAQRRQILQQVSDFRKEDMDFFLPIFRRLAESGTACTIGNREKQEACGEFSEIITIS